MIIVDTSHSIKTLYLTPRNGIFMQAFLIDHISKIKIPMIFDTVYYYNNTLQVQTYFNTSTFTKIEEGKYYTLRLEDASLTTLLNETIFCTNQNPLVYSINNSNYVSLNNTDNFIVYE